MRLTLASSSVFSECCELLLMLLSVKCANGHICRVVAKINVLLIRFYRNFVSCFGFFFFFDSHTRFVNVWEMVMNAKL